MRKIVVAVVFSAVAMAALELENTRPLQAQSSVSEMLEWETPVSGFFIRNHHEVPIVNAEKWEVKIDGLVEKPLSVSLKDLKKLPTRSLHAVLECSGNGRSFHSPRAAGIQWKKGAVGNAEWTGASLAEILKRAKVKPGAKFIRVEGADNPALPTVPAFVRSIPLSKAMEADTLLAWDMNRKPMPLLHGGPIRLVLPRWYGQNWIKWVRHITLTAEEDQGLYMKSAYRMPKTPLKPGEAWDSTTGNPIETLRVQSFIARPETGRPILSGEVEILGKAFSGSGTIAKVEISSDGGASWQESTVESPHASGGWQAFRHAVRVDAEGAHSIWSRATDSAGNTQPMEIEWNPPGYLKNDIDKVEFETKSPKWFALHSLVEDKCLSCHAPQIISSQKLSLEAWKKVLTKMQKFGSTISDEEKENLTQFFSDGSYAPAPVVVAVDFATELARFSPAPDKGANLAEGKKLYGSHCAICHGNSGEGKIGPRLSSRAIPREDFLFALGDGRGLMPSFSASLSEKQMAAIRSYLQR